MKKLIYSKDIFTLCLLISFVFVHFENYQIYISLFLLMIIYNESQTSLLSVKNILLLKILPIYYYLVTFYNAYLKKDLLFWDNQHLKPIWQYLVHGLHCFRLHLFHITNHTISNCNPKYHKYMSF